MRTMTDTRLIELWLPIAFPDDDFWGIDRFNRRDKNLIEFESC